ncbi:MAG TPA: hypothetical protein VES92_05450 [Nitrospiraceae bacterium]|nr:hypothetical protein [Nitrospiraceae bacterium]
MKRILTAAVLGAFTLVTTGLGEAEMFVYPKNSQTKEQQEQDEFSCYKWAKEQTGFDPNKPVEQTSAPAPKGGAVSGAAKGAAVGASGGAIAGDAGKGAAIGAGVGAEGGAHRKRTGEKQQAGGSAASGTTAGGKRGWLPTSLWSLYGRERVHSEVAETDFRRVRTRQKSCYSSE